MPTPVYTIEENDPKLALSVPNNVSETFKNEFERQLFGKNIHSPSPTTSKLKTKEQLERIIYVMKHWDHGDSTKSLDKNQFRNMHKIGYKFAERYVVKDFPLMSDGNEVKGTESRLFYKSLKKP